MRSPRMRPFFMETPLAAWKVLGPCLPRPAISMREKRGGVRRFGWLVSSVVATRVEAAGAGLVVVLGGRSDGGVDAHPQTVCVLSSGVRPAPPLAAPLLRLRPAPLLGL